MVTASAQREPSMEEILASIRRIIEENDDGRKADETSGMPIGFANDERPSAEIETWRAETRPVASVESAPRVEMPARRPEAVERKPMALADVKPAAPQPRQVASMAVAKAPVEAQATPSTLAEVQAQLADVRPTAAPVARELPPVVRPVPLETVAQPKANLEDAVPTGAVDDFAEQPKPAPVKVVPAPAASFRASSVAPAANSFLSSGAERKVQAAFGELSEAFVQRSHVVFDDMARQMMRPLLQEWLDNNLPVIVERLVREEIERVARGV